MGNRLNLVVAGQTDADMQNVVEGLLCVYPRDQRVDSLVGDLDEVRVRNYVDGMGRREDTRGGEEGGNDFPGRVSGDFSERLWGALELLCRERGQTDPETGDIHGDGVAPITGVWDCGHAVVGRRGGNSAAGCIYSVLSCSLLLPPLSPLHLLPASHTPTRSRAAGEFMSGPRFAG